MIAEPDFTMGIEEEYWLIDRETGDLVTEAPKECLEGLNDKLGDRVCPEFLRSQIEIGTPVCETSQQAREELALLRTGIDEVVKEYNIGILAASTHPFAHWDDQVHSEGDHYNSLITDFQSVIKRLLICGMHVHIGIEDDDLRIELLNQSLYFLPHLLALSTSSPFWRGKDTGLQCFRLNLFDGLPRSGLPENLTSFAEYQRLVNVLMDSGAIDNPAKMWWDIRPSVKWPTLEMRITDTCTFLDDAVCIASMIRCILRALYRLRCENRRWRHYANVLINENRWRAQRYGIDAGLIDFGKSKIMDFPVLLEELLEFIYEDAKYFNCITEVSQARNILKYGTSSKQQLSVYNTAIEDGLDEKDALRQVSLHLMKKTLEF